MLVHEHGEKTRKESEENNRDVDEGQVVIWSEDHQIEKLSPKTEDSVLEQCWISLRIQFFLRNRLPFVFIYPYQRGLILGDGQSCGFG